MKELSEIMGAAPSAIRECVAATKQAMNRLEKAREQLDLWQREEQVAKDLFITKQNELNEILRRWDPETQTLKHPQVFAS